MYDRVGRHLAGIPISHLQNLQPLKDSAVLCIESFVPRVLHEIMDHGQGESLAKTPWAQKERAFMISPQEGHKERSLIHVTISRQPISFKIFGSSAGSFFLYKLRRNLVGQSCHERSFLHTVRPHSANSSVLKKLYPNVALSMRYPFNVSGGRFSRRVFSPRITLDNAAFLAEADTVGDYAKEAVVEDALFVAFVADLVEGFH